jgi:alcohol dehydrogenase (cytochrome c)
MYEHGGGTTWMPGTYDPQLNTLYWTTSNPAPDFEGSVRPGDDLYTDCLVALDADTGKLKWYFQFTPHDLFDYDATETPVLVDVTENGETKKLIMQANRNGFLYVLDRTSGKFVSATRFAEKLNWASAIDAQGRPIRTDVKPTPGGTNVCPGYAGATNWFSPSYSESTHLFYFLALEGCQTYFTAEKPQTFERGKEYYSTGVKHTAGEDAQKTLLAFDLSSKTFAWKYPQVGVGRSSGGIMTTTGGLLFFGDDAESFEAVEAQSGKPLWHFNTGQAISSSPMSYAVNGKQYVAIAAGSDVFSFALP